MASNIEYFLTNAQWSFSRCISYLSLLKTCGNVGVVDRHRKSRWNHLEQYRAWECFGGHVCYMCQAWESTKNSQWSFSSRCGLLECFDIVICPQAFWWIIDDCGDVVYAYNLILKCLFSSMFKACDNKGDRFCDGWRSCNIDWLQ